MKSTELDFLKLHEPGLIGLDKAKKAAVCIPLIDTDEGVRVLFEVRSADIESQPGDVCFPGGAVEEGESTAEAALREMREELLVDREMIELIGPADVFGGGSGLLCVYPYAVRLSGYAGTFGRDEVERVFTVPLEWFLENEPEIYITTLKVIPGEDFPYGLIRGGRDYPWRERRDEVLFYRYGDEIIWGMTAKIMHAFTEIVKTGIK